MPKSRSSLRPMQDTKRGAELAGLDPAAAEGPRDAESAIVETHASPDMPSLSDAAEQLKRKRGQPKKLGTSASLAPGSEDDEDNGLAHGGHPTLSTNFDKQVVHHLGSADRNGNTSAVKNLPHTCDVCGKAFSRRYLLHGHLNTHTGEKPFACHYCGRAFADRSNLRGHMKRHRDPGSTIGVRKRGQPREYDKLPTPTAHKGSTPTTKERNRLMKSTSQPSATVHVAAGEQDTISEGVYRIMLDISRKAFHDKSVQEVTITPLSAGEGDALPQGSKVIHLIITDS